LKDTRKFYIKDNNLIRSNILRVAGSYLRFTKYLQKMIYLTED